MRVEKFLSTEILARRQRPTKGCRADDDDDEIPAVSYV
jgi:hypothetical protein